MRWDKSLQWSVYFAVVGTIVIVAFWLPGVMPGKTALALLGLCWDFVGALILVFSVVLQHMALFRLKAGLLEQEKAMPTDWVHSFPIKLAS